MEFPKHREFQPRAEDTELSVSGGLCAHELEGP